jgi:hypothetical protein
MRNKELADNQYYDEDGEICSKLPEGLRNFVLYCTAHGELGYVPSILIKYLEQAHREAIGCIYEIKVFDKEEWDRNEGT